MAVISTYIKRLPVTSEAAPGKQSAASSHGPSPRVPSDLIGHLRSDPQITAQVMPTTQKLPSPHLAGAEMVPSTATGTAPDGLSEQTIFPGIVHETVRRGSMFAQAATREQSH